MYLTKIISEASRYRPLHTVLRSMYQDELKILRRIDRERKKPVQDMQVHLNDFRVNGIWAESYDPAVAAALYYDMLGRHPSAHERCAALRALQQILHACEGSAEKKDAARVLGILVQQMSEGSSAEKVQNIHLFIQLYTHNNGRSIRRTLASLLEQKERTSMPGELGDKYGITDPRTPTEKVFDAWLSGTIVTPILLQDISNIEEARELFTAADLCRIQVVPSFELNNGLYILKSATSYERYLSLMGPDLSALIDKGNKDRNSRIDQMITYFNRTSLPVLNQGMHTVDHILSPLSREELELHATERGAYALLYGHLYTYTFDKLRGLLERRAADLRLPKKLRDQHQELFKTFRIENCMQYYLDIKRALQIPPPYQQVQTVTALSAKELSRTLREHS